MDKIEGIVDRISFSGGEFFLYDGHMDILKRAYNMGIVTSINSKAELSFVIPVETYITNI